MKTNILMLMVASAFIFTSCDSDDGGGNGDGPEQETGTITADQTVIELPDVMESEWSLPSVTATRDQNQINITAKNESTGESLVFLLPDNGVGSYTNPSDDPDLGIATWTPSSGVNALLSVGANEPAPAPSLFVNITSIDTTAMVLSGTFNLIVRNPQDSTHYAVYENGEFTDVPYTSEIDGGGVTLGEGTLSCDVDGEAFGTTNVIVATQSAVNAVSITATNADQQSIALNFPMDVESGTTFEFGGMAQESFAVCVLSPSENYVSMEGSMTVTTHNPADNYIEGTFSFGAGEFMGPIEAEITNGTFTATYPE